ncbi:hypothetical protein TVAG_403740 [Trichomonas vaginalis G3]|uniref:Uncharacterized protein n=1 Tax=Trichomonas vaginalis (strain ATCC PRA-98 / G3) TaxID=412133 RepID=A2ELQ2_TRIV3|nr:hypothetical protein TVAGG3_0895010 [Trichomonas vaginalis G3]EAY06417.1 hypothetical protein TVAG_403740 [Trichomonas vaginalis G3]KAI5503005.1 hypothetical protein TVAGG3_0895010 [Trichomonas vaginalis G3]|eukprot:XP_001318640.1 hypothetical protein [Trichomonas vaginalis G3]
MEATAFSQELQDLKEESANLINSIREFGTKYQERNHSRQILIEDLRELLPEDQFQRFSALLNDTFEESTDFPQESKLEIDIDPEDPLTSLRQAREQIMQQLDQGEA